MCFEFLEEPPYSSIVSVLAYIPTNSAQGFSFLPVLTSTIICLFVNSHSDRCEMTPKCDFDLHFPDD